MASEHEASGLAAAMLRAGWLARACGSRSPKALAATCRPTPSCRRGGDRPAHLSRASCRQRRPSVCALRWARRDRRDHADERQHRTQSRRGTRRRATCRSGMCGSCASVSRRHRTARAAGLTVDAVAAEASADGLVAALTERLTPSRYADRRHGIPARPTPPSPPHPGAAPPGPRDAAQRRAADPSQRSFVKGSQSPQPIGSMPGQNHESIDSLVRDGGGDHRARPWRRAPLRTSRRPRTRRARARSRRTASCSESIARAARALRRRVRGDHRRLPLRVHRPRPLRLPARRDGRRRQRRHARAAGADGAWRTPARAPTSSRRAT